MPETPDISKLAEQLTSHSRRALAKAITLTESKKNSDVSRAQELLEAVMPKTGNSVRIGITGVPGVGKSTFIETLGISLIEQGHKVAVLAVDPSSPNSGGSILGDKTRMQDLMASDHSFIRPSPTGGNLGGVSRKTRESILLCEAAGYDIILVETVGVGQSEYEVASMVDFFMVLMLPGAGDSLQGIKKGILELADMLVINKTDGENKNLARHAKREYENALHLLQPKHQHYAVKVMLCSALENVGLEEVWTEISSFISNEKESGRLGEQRKNQMKNWMFRLTEEMVLDHFHQKEGVADRITQYSKSVQQGDMTPLRASQELLRYYLEK